MLGGDMMKRFRGFEGVLAMLIRNLRHQKAGLALRS